MHWDNFLIEIRGPRGETTSAGVGDLERRTGGRIHGKEVEENVPTEKPPDAKAQGLESIQNLE